jgi:copper chaperone CopZ
VLVSNAVRTFLKLEGVNEEGCAVLTRALQAVEGVVDVEVSIEDGIASVLYDVRVDVPRLVAVVKQAGYDARPL